MSEAVQQSANPWEPVFQQAIHFHGTGQLAEAASLFAAILEHNPQHFPSLQRLAAIRRQQGRLEDSLTLLEAAIHINPESAEARNSLGNTLSSLERPEEAIDQYRQAVLLRENFPEAHQNLGNALKSLGRYSEAAAAYRIAITLRPDLTDAHTNLGIALGRLHQPEQAFASFTAALSLNPNLKLGYSNLAMALTDLNRHEEALPVLRRARERDPDAPQPVFHEAITHLAMGNLELGWPDYEVRWRNPGFRAGPRSFIQPRWDGHSPIAGKTILLHAEQGLGDTILFSRFIESIVNRGAQITLEVQKPLQTLLAAIPGVTQVLTSDDPLPAFDTRLPFGSLPLVLQTTMKSLPSRVPYLQSPAHSATLDDLDDALDSRPLVGVCWAGNPKYTSDHKRSIPLPVFQRLFEIPNIRFVSLQQNLREGEQPLGNINWNCIRKSQSLADTAALQSKLDLIITVDTAMAHLAGALARPVWVLLPFSSSWVWQRFRTDSPWYPTARLFRQTQAGNWNGVIEDVAAALTSSVRPFLRHNGQTHNARESKE